MRQHQRALAEIVQHQRRQHQTEPGKPDREAAEMAHVGVERLAAGHRQHHRAQRDEGHQRVVGNEVRRVGRRHRDQHHRVIEDLLRAQRDQHREPDHRHRPEGAADAAVSAKYKGAIEKNLPAILKIAIGMKDRVGSIAANVMFFLLHELPHELKGRALAEAGRIQEAIAYLEKAQRPQSDPEVAKLLDKVRASTKD